MFVLLELECVFSGLKGNGIVGSCNLRSLGVSLSLHTIYNTHKQKKNTHTLTLRVFTRDPKLNLTEMKFRFAIIKILFKLVFIRFVLIFWSTMLAFIKNSHAQMFPFRWFHFGVVFTKHVSPEMKFHFFLKKLQWNNTSNEVNNYMRWTKNRTKNISFSLKWNSCKQPLTTIWGWLLSFVLRVKCSYLFQFFESQVKKYKLLKRALQVEEYLEPSRLSTMDLFCENS